MPSVSKKQHNLMAAVAHNPQFAKKVGIKQSVGKEFTAADKGKTFAKGGTMAKMKHDDIVEDKKMIKKAVGMHDKQLHGGKKTDLAALKKGGCTKMCGGGKTKKMAGGGLAAGHKSADGIATKGKTKARAVTMKKGGKC
jgi:hypothetical protein